MQPRCDVRRHDRATGVPAEVAGKDGEQISGQSVTEYRSQPLQVAVHGLQNARRFVMAPAFNCDTLPTPEDDFQRRSINTEALIRNLGQDWTMLAIAVFVSEPLHLSVTHCPPAAGEGLHLAKAGAVI
jgi:hypothetical protein